MDPVTSWSSWSVRAASSAPVLLNCSTNRNRISLTLQLHGHDSTTSHYLDYNGPPYFPRPVSRPPRPRRRHHDGVFLDHPILVSPMSYLSLSSSDGEVAGGVLAGGVPACRPRLARPAAEASPAGWLCEQLQHCAAQAPAGGNSFIWASWCLCAMRFGPRGCIGGCSVGGGSGGGRGLRGEARS